MKPLSPQEKKAYLMRYGDCAREIARLEEELAVWKSRAERITARYGPTAGRRGGPDADRVQTGACEIAQLREELGLRLSGLAAVRREIERAIGSVGEDRLRLLLRYRYVDGLTLEQIAGEMHYSERQVANLFRQAIERVAIGC